MSRLDVIVDKVKERLQTEVLVQTVTRDSYTYTGICIGDGSIRPNINFDAIVEDIEDWEQHIDEVVEKVIEIYNEVSAINVPVEEIKSWEPDKVIGCLVPRKDWGDDRVVIPFLDLDIIFKKEVFNDDDNGTGRMVITNSLLEEWNITSDQLFETAKVNARNSLSMMKLFELMFDLMSGLETKNSMELSEDEPTVITNYNRSYGAFAMLVLPQLLNVVNRDLYILPSSVHECILIPVDATEDKADGLMDMVKVVNATEVSEEDFLSNSVYRFDASTREISIVKESL